MRTNINKFQELYDMHPHIAENLTTLLNNYLPHGYSSEIVKRADKEGIETSKQTIRNVKSGLYKNVDVLNLLVELAKEQKAVAEALTQKLTV